MNLTLGFPAKPYKVNQKWGVPNPVYAQFGFTQHNGVDVAPGDYKMVYSELPSGTVYKIGWQPTGGGLYLSILSDEAYDFPDGKKCHVLIDYLHLESIKAQVGTSVKVGDHIATADNTGFSTGPHTHIQYRRVDKVTGGLNDVDQNEAHNSFDPEPYRVTPGFHYVFNINLKFGALASPEVTKLQQALQFLGYMPPVPFGPYGAITRNAMAKFQAAFHIVDPDGAGTNFGPSSRAAMNKLVAKK